MIFITNDYVIIKPKRYIVPPAFWIVTKIDRTHCYIDIYMSVTIFTSKTYFNDRQKEYMRIPFLDRNPETSKRSDTDKRLRFTLHCHSNQFRLQ